MPALIRALPHPADIVPGILCPKGHFNHRLWRHCTRCGSALLDRGSTTTYGPRPVVGNLIRDDGLRHPIRTGFFLTARVGQGTARVWVTCLEWTPWVLARSEGVRWQPDPGAPDAALSSDTPIMLRPGGLLHVGMDRFHFVPVAGTGDHAAPRQPAHGRHRRRRVRLPDHTTFSGRSTT